MMDSDRDRIKHAAQTHGWSQTLGWGGHIHVQYERVVNNPLTGLQVQSMYLQFSIPGRLIRANIAGVGAIPKQKRETVLKALRVRYPTATVD